MPVVFIHGVNVRDRYQNENDALAMGELLVERVFRPLASAGVAPFAALRLDPLLMRVPYWGDDGVQFRWRGATLPKLRTTDIFGAPTAAGGPSQTQVVAMANLLGQDPAAALPEQPLLQAARTDLRLFLEIVLAPLIESETRLVASDPALLQRVDEPDRAGDEGTSPRPVGPMLEALLVEAADQVADDAELKHRIDSDITDDDDLIEQVQKQLLDRFRDLVKQQQAAPGTAATTARSVDVMGGGVGGALKEASDRIKEFFVRVAQSPLRIPSVAALRVLRAPLNAVFTRFSGDVFEYLLRRGDAQQPGRIPQVILSDLDTAKTKRPGEPLIVITHSMGGNIFYDILTYFRPDLDVDLWLSVGGQVGLFEEMKLFHASDPKVQAPQKINTLAARVKCWRNIYDPADPAAFLAEPVFANVKDVRFSTGAGDYHTHLNYFKRSRFYRSLHRELEEAFPK